MRAERRKKMPRLLDVKKLMEYLSIGRDSARNIGEAAGAVIRIGSRVLYDRLKIDTYIDSMGTGSREADAIHE